MRFFLMNVTREYMCNVTVNIKQLRLLTFLQGLCQQKLQNAKCDYFICMKMCEQNDPTRVYAVCFAEKLDETLSAKIAPLF